MHVFNISFFRKYKLYIVITLAIIIAVVLMIISFSSVISLPKINIVVDESDIFNLNSYSAEYVVIEISNKNRNTYKVKEWYKKIFNSEFFKFNSNDELNNEVSYIIANGKIKIQNASQLSTYILNESKLKKTNLYSISTYIDIITDNDLKCIRINTLNEEENEKYEIILDTKIHDKCSEDCKYNDLFKEGLKLSKIEIILNKNIPKHILVLNDKNEIYLDINYTKFNLNDEINDEMFVF